MNASDKAREHRRLGHVAETRGDLASALVDFEQAASCFPDEIQAIATIDRLEAALASMNRGNVLFKQGPSTRDAAVAAYDRTIQLLSDHYEPAPEALVTLGAAWLNRGQAWLRPGCSPDLERSAASLSRACAVLADPRMPVSPSTRRLRAGAHLNLATVALLRRDPEDSALAEARRALEPVVADEYGDLAAADLALKARRALCEALSLRLHAADPSTLPALVQETSDIVDAGVTLWRAWEERGETALRVVGERVLRFGLRFYARYQSHFLSEYLREAIEWAPPGSPWIAGVKEEGRTLLEAGSIDLTTDLGRERHQLWRELSADDASR